MKKIKLNFFEIFSIFWMSVVGLVLIFSILDLFGLFAIISSTILVLASLIYFKNKKVFEVESLTNSFKLLFLLVLIFGLTLSYFSTPSIFGGRDEGSYSNAGILLAQEGQRSHGSELIENFFDIYGESKALNFPGFEYNQNGYLESQFLPGYPAWLAIFYKLFGLNGINFANLIPFLTFVLSFYLIIAEVFPLINENKNSKECLEGSFIKNCWLKLRPEEQYAWLGAIFLLTFMPLTIFYKLTLSEIYYSSLAWFGLYLFIRYLKVKSFLKFKIIFIPLILMLFVRIETFAIIFAFLLIMIGKDFNHLRQARYQFFFALSVGVLFFLMWLEPNFFINAVKGVTEISGLNANAIPEARETNMIYKLIPDDWKSFYSLKILYTYNLIPFLLMASFFLITFFKSVLKDRKFGKEKAQLIVPFFIFSPTFIYLIDANISLDHPWMLRRLIFSIIPLFLFYSIFFLFYLQKRNQLLFRLIVIFVILGNLSLFIIPSKEKIKWFNFSTFSQNNSLLKQTEDLSKMFGKDDLILISQKSSGSGWSLMAEPMRNLFGRQAVYFFNPRDYSELDHNDFNEIYLITTPEEEFLYENMPKEKISERIVFNQIIEPSRSSLQKPQIIETQTKINIYRIFQEN